LANLCPCVANAGTGNLTGGLEEGSAEVAGGEDVEVVACGVLDEAAEEEELTGDGRGRGKGMAVARERGWRWTC
jgi:hypothetical protein